MSEKISKSVQELKGNIMREIQTISEQELLRVNQNLFRKYIECVHFEVINFNICCDAGKPNVLCVAVPLSCRPFSCKSGGRRANSRSVQGRLPRYGLSLNALCILNIYYCYIDISKKLNIRQVQEGRITMYFHSVDICGSVATLLTNQPFECD